MEVAQYAGWDYEFVTVDGTINEQLSTLLDMLMNGKIDLMGCLAYNDSLGEMFDYPSSNYGTSYYNLSVLDKNGKIDNTNFFTFNPLRVGIFGTPGQQMCIRDSSRSAHRPRKFWYIKRQKPEPHAGRGLEIPHRLVARYGHRRNGTQRL